MAKATIDLPTWNLSDLFRGLDDPAVDEMLQRASKRADEFDRMYRGKVGTPALSASELLAALRAYEAILQDAAKPVIYAMLVFEGDASRPEHGAFLQRMKAANLEISRKVLFFELDLIKMDEGQVERVIAGATGLENYRHYLKKLFVFKPHRLSEPEEKILNDKSLTGRSAFTRLFDEELALKRYRVARNGKVKELTEAEVHNLLHSPKREERRKAALAITQGLRGDLRRLAYITNTLLEDKSIDDRLRRFPAPEAGRHLSNEIDQDTVDAMVDAVTRNYGLVHDFYRFKQRVLDLRRLYDYDRYAPVIQSRVEFSFDDAREMVLSAFTAFSPIYGEAAAQFFRRNWIDAPPRFGKSGGAFCHYVTPDLHPYVFLNYTGDARSVLTLAHELGHGVHAYLAREQTYLNFNWPLTIAETASVFGEMVVFDKLKHALPGRREKFALHFGKIEEIFATVFRQIAMYRFEQDLHRARRDRGELTPEAIGALWRTRQQEMFGASVRLTPNYDIWWSYIPHFVHVPFYVYAYAFGELLTLALYARYKHEGQAFVDRYLAILAAGGSKSPRELLEPMGVNLSAAEFWQGGLDIIRQMIEEAQSLQ